MEIKDILNKIQERFGEAVEVTCEVECGDPFIVVAASKFFELAKFVKEDEALAFDFLRLITGVDLGDKLASVYHLYSYKHKHALTLRVDLDRDKPVVASVCTLWPSADWLEREAYDMVGIKYEGHPDLRRILLPLDWEGHPLRKDYEFPVEYHGVKHD